MLKYTFGAYVANGRFIVYGNCNWKYIKITIFCFALVFIINQLIYHRYAWYSNYNAKYFIYYFPLSTNHHVAIHQYRHKTADFHRSLIIIRAQRQRLSWRYLARLSRTKRKKIYIYRASRRVYIMIAACRSSRAKARIVANEPQELCGWAATFMVLLYSYVI